MKLQYEEKCILVRWMRVHKYNNTYNTNKKRPIHINSGTYIVFYTENHYKDPRFKFDGNVRIS